MKQTETQIPWNKHNNNSSGIDLGSVRFLWLGIASLHFITNTKIWVVLFNLTNGYEGAHFTSHVTYFQYILDYILIATVYFFPARAFQKVVLKKSQFNFFSYFFVKLQSFTRVFKAFIKPFEVQQKKCENKNFSWFSLFGRDRNRKG